MKNLFLKTFNLLIIIVLFTPPTLYSNNLIPGISAQISGCGQLVIEADINAQHCEYQWSITIGTETIIINTPDFTLPVTDINTYPLEGIQYASWQLIVSCPGQTAVISEGNIEFPV